MNRSILLPAVLLLCATGVLSQDIDLRGTVTNAAGGAALSGVQVGLAGRPGLTDMTDGSGHYAISTATAVAGRAFDCRALSGSRLEGNCVLFSVHGCSPVTVDVFSAHGARVGSLLRDAVMARGAYRLDLSALGLVPGTYVVRYSQGRERSAFRFGPAARTGVLAGAVHVGSGSVSQAKALAGVVDTLVFSLTDFSTLRLPIMAYTGQYDVSLVGPVPVVWINEIHYDNEGADVNEGVEIAGTAGTDLAGWRVAFYNGNPSVLTNPDLIDLHLYMILDLTGFIPNQQNGYGVIGFAISGIQGGGTPSQPEPDGLALVDSQSNVVQFLSYEGTFQAISGPANGMHSTDIGVAEAQMTPVGQSLQLMGTGKDYTDFTWSGPKTATQNQVNADQTFQP